MAQFSRLSLSVRFVGVMLLTLISCGEQRREKFATGTEALASDTARRGWIPPWLPHRATAIDIRYDLDTNYRWLNFRLQPSAAVALQSQLREMPEQRIRSLALRRPRGNADWPEGLIQQQPANDAALYARVFCGTGQPVPLNTCFAFEERTGNVFVWIPHEGP